MALNSHASSSKTPSYLQPTASTAQRAASAPAFKRTWPPPRHVPPQPRAPLASAKESQPISGDDPFSKEGSKSSMPKSRAIGPLPVHPCHAEGRFEPPEPPHDILQVAAQVQSWLFMQSSLQDSLSILQKGAQDSHNALVDAISNDTSHGSGTSRVDAGILVTFLDDLANAGPDSRFAPFIHRYLEHEKSWLKLQSELTQFVARLSQAPSDSSLEEGQRLKARLGEEGSRIESLLTEDELWGNESGRVRRTLAQLYPVLHARSENVSIASDAIDCSLDNIRAICRLKA